MIDSACMGLTQRIGGGLEVLNLFVEDRNGRLDSPRAKRAEIEKLPDPSII